jgi:uncharacterized damage-inducible protein DinB
VCHVTTPLPEATDPPAPRAEVFLAYLDHFRSVVVAGVDGLPDDALRTSLLPSGWSPLELVKHLTHVERRWLVWGFEGSPVADPWGDARDGRWHVEPDESAADLVRALQEQGAVTARVVRGHELSDAGRPSERWEGAAPPTLERVLFHLLQEYARHVGHLDVVRELLDGRAGD